MSDSTTPSKKDSALFRYAVGPVQRIQQDRVCIKPKKRAVIHKNSTIACTSAIVPASPTQMTLAAADRLYYLCEGMQKRELKRLYRGYYPIRQRLDLHQMTVAVAYEHLSALILRCDKRQAVMIIHGKGHSSPNRQPILKNKLNQWLRQSSAVLAFCSARPQDGGTGAVYVLVKKNE